MIPGTRVALLPVKKLPDEWRGKRGTVVCPPVSEASVSAAAKWIWVAIDGEKTTYFYKSELRPLGLIERIGELT